MNTNRQEGKAAAEFLRLVLYGLAAIAAGIVLVAGLAGVPAYFFEGDTDRTLEVFFGIVFVAAFFAFVWRFAKQNH